MSDRQNLVTAVASVLSGITNIGVVQARQRYSATWDKYLQQFATTISSTKQIRGWVVRMAPTNPVVPGLDLDGGALGGTVRVHNVQVVGLIGLSDASSTEDTIGDLVEAVMDALDDKIDLSAQGATHVLRYGVGPCAWTTNDIRLFGSVLCNYVEITVPVTVTKTGLAYA